MEEQKFDQLYIDFWRKEILGDRLVRDRDLIIKLGQLRPGSTVLDLGAGIGRISLALANCGIHVVGIERSEEAIAEATRERHAHCQFIRCDWLKPAWEGRFDCILFWFTTLCAGYESDMEALRVAHASLSDKGSLLIETRHWDRMTRIFDSVTKRQTGQAVLIEKHSYDPITGIQTTEEQFVLDSENVRRRYQIRRYSFPELRQMCLDAGFRNIDGFDENSDPLTNNSERAVLRAQRC